MARSLETAMAWLRRQMRQMGFKFGIKATVAKVREIAKEKAKKERQGRP